MIPPDVLVEKYGADTVRAYLMFFARWDLGGPWDSQGIEGSARWLRRVWTAFTEPVESAAEPGRRGDQSPAPQAAPDPEVRHRRL